MSVIQVRDAMPHFDVTRIDGTRVRYASIWQRKNLLFVSLGRQTGEADHYAAQLEARMAEIAARDAECVITRDVVPGVPSPGAVVADRWGEVHFVAAALPPPDELIDWLDYVQVKCPECEGESR